MIRNATHDDIPTMIALGAAMHAESRYARFPWNSEKVSALIAALIDSDDGLALVTDDGDGALTGGMLAAIEDSFFGEARFACEFAVFVRPDARGGIAAARLLRAYAQWARDSGADLVQAGITTGVNVEASARLYAGVGFQPIGTLFEYQEKA
jgi:GNAT superfamily N-acetyltransferase